MTTLRCGPLTFDTATGECRFDGQLVGSKDTLDVAALVAAASPASPQPQQSLFDFPVPLAEADLLPLSLDDTLREANRRTMALVRAGKPIHCPCCTRDGQMRDRKIHREMARAVGSLARHSATSKSKWHHLRDFLPRNATASKASSDIAFLVYWDVVERNPRHRGEYRILEKGKKWVNGELALERIAWVYGARALHFSTETVMYKDAVAENLDLDFGDGDSDSDIDDHE